MVDTTEKSVSPHLTGLDQEAFGILAGPFRRELGAHCYRMMGTVQDAEDMVQETFLRAWRRRETYEGRASFRAWLYKIATNACLDALRQRPRRAVPRTRQPASDSAEPMLPSLMEPIWLEPYPDDWLVVGDDSPEDYISSREDIALAFIAALHLLPARQRAVLILRDVLDWQASEVADLLDTSVSAVKSALHRARSTLAANQVMPDSDEVAYPLDERTQTQLDQYVRAWENGDVDALLHLLTSDAAFSMPPTPSWYRGRDEVGDLVAKTIFSGDAVGRWSLLPTRANRQIAFGLYRQSDDPAVYAAYGVQVLTFSAGLIADITTFRTPALVPYFNLPTTI